MSFTKWVNTSSPGILRLVETCEEQAVVILEVPVRDPDGRPGAQRSMVVTMHDVTVTKVTMADTADDVAPKERVEVQYGRAEIEFVEVAGDN